MAVALAVANPAQGARAEAPGALSLAAPTRSESDDVLRPFNHWSHVNRLMRSSSPEDEEVWRDCRGCHGFPGDSEIDPVNGHEPQQVCHRCHNPQGEGLERDGRVYRLSNSSFPTGPDELSAAAPALQTSLDILEQYYAVPGFAHTDHLKLACTRCHDFSPEQELPYDGPGADLLKSPEEGRLQYPIPVGAGVCIECHDDGSADIDPKTEGLFAVESPPTRADWTGGPSTFFTRINEDFAATQGQGAETHFDHRDHLTEGSLGREGAWGLAELHNSLSAVDAAPGDVDCASCHGAIFEAGPTEVHLAELQQGSCSSCHVVNEARNGVEFASESVEVASRAFLTFSHADHLRSTWKGQLATSDGYKELDEQSCHACHQWSEELPDGLGGMRAPTYDLREDRSWDFRGCLDCHDVPAFTASDGVNQNRNWGHIEGGSGPGWETCQTCHAFGNGPLGDVPRRATVTRLSPTGFQLLSQAHPFITPGEAGQESCADCHKADLDSLPSRIGRRRFTHETHVPEWDPSDPSSLETIEATCVTCHASRVFSTSGSADIGVVVDGRRIDESSDEWDTHGLLTYDPTACAECHRGVGRFLPPEDVQAETPATSAPDFPHDLHLFDENREPVMWPPDGDAPMRCTTCHLDTSGADPLSGEDALGTLPDAMDCTMCHRHGEREDLPPLTQGVSMQHAMQITGQAGRQAVQACERCHSVEVPTPDVSELLVQRVRVTGRSGAQHHPADASGQDCATCHQAQPSRNVLPSLDAAFLASAGITAPAGYTQEFAFVGSAGAESDRRPDALPGYTDVHGLNGLDKPRECIDCHWGVPITSQGTTNDPTDDRTRYPNEGDRDLRQGRAEFPFPGFGQ